MGCSTSKLDNEDAVLSCKERRLLMKQAVEHRYEFAEAHMAYINALKNVGSALRGVIEGDDIMSLGSSLPTTPLFTSPAPTTSETSSGSLPEKSACSPSDSASKTVVNHLRSGNTTPLYFEERPPSPESVRVESYSSGHQFDMDGFFSTHLPHAQYPMTPSYNNHSDYLPPPPSPPRASTWDIFNPFISLDNPYPYYDQRRLSQVCDDEDIATTNMKRVREEEGIPELEEEGKEGEKKETQAPPDPVEPPKEEPPSSEAAVESNADALTEAPSEPAVETVATTKAESVAEEIPTKSAEGSGAAVAEKAVDEVKEEKPVEGEEVKDKEVTSEKTNVPAIVTHRPMSMLKATKDIEDQFMRACEYGKDVAEFLEARKVHYSSSLNDFKVHSSRVLSGSISLIRSLSRSSSSRSYLASSSSKDDADESSSDFGEDYCIISCSHSSTLEKIYAWEKKLYDEVKDGEHLRITYEKKCMQLRNQDDKGEDPQVIDKTRATIKSLHTRIKVSIHKVDSISKKIQKLSTEELQQQLAELIQGLMHMWKGMLDCHQIQYQIIRDTKSLSSSAAGGISTESHQQATNHLENALNDWHRSFSKLFGSQKAYIQALYEWLSKCIMPESKNSNSRMPSSGAPSIFFICHDWCHAFGPMPEKQVIEKIHEFAIDVHAVWEQQDEEHRQKKRAEYLSKDLDRRVAHLQRVESRRHDRNFNSDGTGPTDNAMTDQKISIESFRKRVEEEKARHQKVLHQTQSATLKILMTGLESTLEALIQFASVSLKEYEQLHAKCQNNALS